MSDSSPQLPLDLPSRSRSSSSTRSSPTTSSRSSPNRVTISPQQIAPTDIETSYTSPTLAVHLDTGSDLRKEMSGSLTLSRIQSIAREHRAKIADINLGQKTSAMANVAKTKGAEWTRFGRDRLEKWKARNSQDLPNQASGEFPGEVSIFGQPLEDAVIRSSISGNCPVPTVVARCIEFLDCNALTEVGLYRVPGSASAVANLKAIFDDGNDLDLLSTSEDPHTVATLLKMYLRELPDPIIPQELLSKFNECLPDSTESSSEQRQQQNQDVPKRLANVATYLPEPNYYLLLWLMSHLARLDFYSKQNKMTASNLGLIFCPTLLIGSQLFTAFVNHVDTIFPLPRMPCVEEAQISSNNSAPTSRNSNRNFKQSILRIPAANRVPPPRPPRSPPNQNKPNSRQNPKASNEDVVASLRSNEVPIGNLIDFDLPIVTKLAEHTLDRQISNGDNGNGSTSDIRSNPTTDITAATYNNENELDIGLLNLDSPTSETAGNYTSLDSLPSHNSQTLFELLDSAYTTSDGALQNPMLPSKSESFPEKSSSRISTKFTNDVLDLVEH